MNYTVSDAIIDTLKAHWVSTLFGYPGWAVIPFYDKLSKHKEMKHVLVRHEQACWFAAQGWARTTKDIWVCIATSWPWATNVVTAIADAYLDSIPMLFISGQVPLNTIWNDMFQEVDMTGITLNITKHNYIVEKWEDAVKIVTEAIAIAKSGRPWPVHIDLPKDISTMEHPRNFQIPKIDLRKNHPMLKAYDRVDLEKVDQVVSLLNKAKKPVLLIGQWIKHANAEKEIDEFIEKTWIPTVSTLLAKWILKDWNENYLWMLWMHWFYHSNEAMHNADLILNIWSRFDDRIVWNYSSFWKNAKIIHIDIDKSELNKVVKVDFSIHTDAKIFLKEVLTDPNLKKLDIENWKKEIQDNKNKHPYKKDTKWFSIRTVILQVTQLSKDNTDNFIFITDVWQHQMWSALWLEIENPKNWLTSWWSWTMWFWLPVALWAAFANPNKTVVVIAWDWGAQMNIQELATIKDHNLNIKFLIVNNSFLWMVRQWQDLFFDKNYSSVDITSPDFKKVSEAYWIEWFQTNKREESFEILKEVLNKKWPNVVEFKVEKEDNVFPMVPWGKTLGETINEK